MDRTFSRGTRRNRRRRLGAPVPWAAMVSVVGPGLWGCERPARDAEPAAAALESRWRMVEEVTIGAVEGPGPDVFGRIVGLEMDEERRIYVLDAQARELRIFDEAGGHLRTVGHSGAGPGELGSINGMAWDPEGRLWVVDPGNGRYTLFDREGNFLDHVGRPEGLGGGNIWSGTIDRSGILWESRLRTDEVGAVGRTLIRVDLAGAVRDTIPLPWYHPPVYEAAGIRAVVPLTPILGWVVGPDGSFWMGMTGAYRLARLGPQSDTLAVIEKDHRPVPVTAAERRAALESDPGVRRVRDFGGVIDPDLVPSERPAFTRLAVARDGSLWVWVSVPDAAPPLIEVFNDDGLFMGTAEGFGGLALWPRPVIDGNHMLAVVEDELGVQNVVRYRVEPAP